MFLEVAKIVTCLLWLLLCLRFYTMISRNNVWQRRFIAIGAGLGAGLIYLVGTMMITVIKAPSSSDAPAAEQAQDVHIKPRPAKPN